MQRRLEWAYPLSVTERDCLRKVITKLFDEVETLNFGHMHVHIHHGIGYRETHYIQV